MRSLATLVVMVAAASTALAEITTEERFQDCLGTRAAAVGFEAWAASPCQSARACPDYTPDDGIGQGGLICIGEVVNICAVAEGLYSDACFDEAQPFLDRLMSEHSITELRDALGRVSGMDNMLQALRAERYLEFFNADFLAECSIRKGSSVLENRERACAFEREIFRLRILDSVARFVAEVDAE